MLSLQFIYATVTQVLTGITMVDNPLSTKSCNKAYMQMRVDLSLAVSRLSKLSCKREKIQLNPTKYFYKSALLSTLVRWLCVLRCACVFRGRGMSAESEV